MGKHQYMMNLEGAKAVGRDLPISMKHSVEVCAFVKGKDLQHAKQLLKEVIVLKRAVPYYRFNQDLGHKKGMASGRYPQKTAKEILKVIESAEVNAQFKGMNTSRLRIAHLAAHLASRPFQSGRHRGRKMKRTHIEVIVQEYKKQDKEQKSDKK
ncbi:50S ribosomal protein L22 [Candidatus Woesearchaeota archaeon]|nr:50S ribosomal protein L22 [Candidatus Woesearchaeota archaeon]